MYHIVIEQTKNYKKRMKYDPIKNTFYETEYESLAHVRNFLHPHGWIKESGTPPKPHLDIILLSTGKYELGDEVEVKIIGCFMRNDGDSKLIGILPERLETDFFELPEIEKTDLQRLYPRLDKGEGWFGAAKAEEIIKGFFEKQMNK
jgi:hypothetical protein